MPPGDVGCYCPPTEAGAALDDVIRIKKLGLFLVCFTKALKGSVNILIEIRSAPKSAAKKGYSFFVGGPTLTLIVKDLVAIEQLAYDATKKELV